MMRSFIRSQYFFAVTTVALSTACCFMMFPFFELTNLVMIYLLGTLMVALKGNRGAAAFCASLSVLCFDFFFVPPRFTLSVASVQYVWTFFVMFVTSMMISHLVIRLRSEAESAREGQKRTEMMHVFTQQLSIARGKDEIILLAVRRLAESFNAKATVFLPDANGRLDLNLSAGDKNIALKHLGVAQWVYDRKQPAGSGTEVLPSEDSLYVPLVGAERIVGVVGLLFQVREATISAEQRLLLNSFTNQIALALEVDRLQESTTKAEVEAETERLRSALLSSVSHDFRTPLTAIVGSASALIDKEEIRNGPKGLELLETIQAEGERLSRLVQNLLDATRLESGSVHVKKELYSLEEVLAGVLARLEKALRNHSIVVAIPEDLPVLLVDGMLIEQVFTNLLENAIRHAPINSPIEISAKTNADAIVVSVADQGPGLNEADLERVFDKFYHDKMSPGAGLGLAICRAVVHVHGGRIWAENKVGGGAIFCFGLPLSKSDEQ